MRYITIKQLQAHGACREQVIKFRRRFGSRVTVTVEKAVKHAHALSFTWAGRNLLRGVYRQHFNRRYDELERKKHAAYQPAQFAYGEALAVLQPQIDACPADLYGYRELPPELKASRAHAREVRNAARIIVERDMARRRAEAFAQLYLKQPALKKKRTRS